MKYILKEAIGIKNIKYIQLVKRYLRSIFNKLEEEDRLLLSRIEADFPSVMTVKETLEIIKRQNLSVARFGDAEFDIMKGLNENDPYQRPSQELSDRLLNILKDSEDGKILICIPPFNYKTNNLKYFKGKLSFWEWYWLNRFYKLNDALLGASYGNSFVTRESVFYECELDHVMDIWKDKKVVFVYSKEGRFEPDHKIFGNVKEKHYVLVSPTNAFDDYDYILNKCNKYSPDSLFLIAAGPTATVLAYDLAKSGYQAIDIGHLPNSYNEFDNQIISPESIPLIK